MSVWPGTHARQVLTALLAVVAVSAQAEPPCRTIDTDQLHAMVVDNAYKLEGGHLAQFTVVDTRSAERYHQGHVFSAVNIQAQDLSAALSVLPKDTTSPIVLYGDEPELKTTGEFCALLSKAGYTNVQVYSEPFQVWKEKHLPIVQRIEQ